MVRLLLLMQSRPFQNMRCLLSASKACVLLFYVSPSPNAHHCKKLYVGLAYKGVEDLLPMPVWACGLYNTICSGLQYPESGTAHGIWHQ